MEKIKSWFFEVTTNRQTLPNLIRKKKRGLKLLKSEMKKKQHHY